MNKERSITLEKHPLFALVRAPGAAALFVAHSSERLRHKFTRRDLMLKNQSAWSDPKYSGDFAKLNIRVLLPVQLANEVTFHPLLPGDTIDTLAQQVRGYNVACVRRDHVVIDPTQRHLTESLVVEAIVERRSHECLANQFQFVQEAS